MVTVIDRLGTWDDVWSGVDGDRLAVGEHVRSLVTGLHADTTIVPRKGDGAVSFGFGEKKMRESYCYVAPKTKWVNLGFWHGVDLPDPDGLMEGTGKRLRHVKLRDLATARSAAVARLVHAAMEERRMALGEG